MKPYTKKEKQRLNGKKKRLEHSHQNQKFIATKSMMVTTFTKLVARTMTRTTKTNKQTITLNAKTYQSPNTKWDLNQGLTSPQPLTQWKKPTKVTLESPQN